MRRRSDETKNIKMAYQNIRLEDSREIAKLLSPVTICLPGNLVEAIVKPVAEIGSWSSPRLIIK